MFKPNLNKLLVIAGSVVAVLIIVFIFWWNKEIVISNGIIIGAGGQAPKSLITGTDCASAGIRPIGVMLASDPEARPLSGIGQADMVFEMPVDPTGITRFLAVFQCENPKEIGSIRSARNDFIPLAVGTGIIYAHWGGEHSALERLDGHIIDNVDAMKYEGDTFYRKTGIRQPHNGFSNLDLITKKAKDLGYDFKNTFAGYPHQDKQPNINLSNLASQISVNYPDSHSVSWTYDSGSNLYSRSRNNTPEADRNTGQTVKASVVILMNTASKFLREQYIAVDVQGEGPAWIYQNGGIVNGKWKKDPSRLDSKLYFYDDSGKEVLFAPGKIWVEVVTN